MVIVISGPGGVGKGTVVAELVAADPRLWLSRSWTTRRQRPGEPADAYVFVTREQFQERIAGGGFLEWAEFMGNLYGTPLPDSKHDRDVVLEIDVQGAAQVKAEHPDALLIFMTAPSRAEQRARLAGRGDDEDAIAARLAAADDEEAACDALEARRVVNADVDRTVAEIQDIIEAARRC